MINQTHDAAIESWVESANAADCEFPIQNLPFCVFSCDGRPARGGIGIGDRILDLHALQESGLLDGQAAMAARAACGAQLNPLLGMGHAASSALRHRVSALLSNGKAGEKARAQADRLTVSMADAHFHLPVRTRSFSDFTCSLDHTRRRQGKVPDVLWRLPVAYHGRASSIRLDGTPVIRPLGQYREDAGNIVYGAEPRLDFELEFATYVGVPSALGQPVSVGEAASHIFGYTLLNDWSARGIQHCEMMLGPFLGKSFLTTVSPWIVTHEALAPFRIPAVAREDGQIGVPPHLSDPDDQHSGGLDIELTADLSTATMRAAGLAPERIVVTNFAEMVWTFAQMLAHQTSNGCNVETGDLIASGTVSGSSRMARACMGEINERGEAVLELANGEKRVWLNDGDEITLRGIARREGFASIGFGTCSGVVVAERAA